MIRVGVRHSSHSLCLDLAHACRTHKYNYEQPVELATSPAGIAHLLEHMAFKGSERIGTLDFRQEAPILDALDEGVSLVSTCAS